MESSICKNCAHAFTGKFCNECGEKLYSERDKSVKHIFEEAFHFFTHFEGKFLNTLKAIVSRPGKLSLDYCDGIRKKYFKPLSFFLLLVILYLFFPVFEGLNMKLKYHNTHVLYGSYAREVTTRIMQERNLSDEQLSELFHRKGEKTSKFSLFIVIPFMALISWAMRFRQRKYFYDHFIFSAEAISFYVLWGFLFLPLILVLFDLAGISYPFTQDWQLGIVTIIGFIIFLTLASRRFFKLNLSRNILFTIVFALSMVFFLEFIYKFILFVIVIHLI